MTHYNSNAKENITFTSLLSLYHLAQLLKK